MWRAKPKFPTPLISSDTKVVGGIGIVFLQAPDKSLFVKSLIEGSGAAHSGIKCGDCLMKVNAPTNFSVQKYYRY